MRQTTPGQLLLRSKLPQKYHTFLEEKPLSTKRIDKLFKSLALSEPRETYRKITKDFSQLGDEVASNYGKESSLDVRSFLSGPKLARKRMEIQDKVQEIQSGTQPIPEKEKQLVSYLTTAREDIKSAVKDNLKGTALGVQVNSGVRGNIDQVTDLLVGEFLPTDRKGNPVPFPVLRGYAEGLTPTQYWTTAQKARTGLIGVKLATPQAGDISNQLMRAVHRLRVTQDKEPPGKAGLPVDLSDPDYEGSILAEDITGVAKRGQKLTPERIRLLRSKGISRALIHSPITSQAEFGISREAAGSATGEPYSIGAFAGIEATQSISEPLTQASIGSKHVGQRSGAGLEFIRQLLAVPTEFPGAAAIARSRGKVKEVRDRAAGGKVIVVGDRDYLVPPGEVVTVKPGEIVHIGDIMSNGVPNPATLVKLLGIGEGRRRYAHQLSRAFKNSGIDHNKRNVEYMARGLINHVRITEPFKDYMPGDLVEYSSMARTWEPREGATKKPPRSARGFYLEEPAAHYTIGTKITEGIAKDLKDLGFDTILVNREAPPYKPEMRRAREALRHAEDWITRLGGSGLKRSILKALYSGKASSDPEEPTSLFSQLLLEGAPKEIK